jgi:putative DNA primase/helicase
MTDLSLIKERVPLSQLFASKTHIERRGRDVFALCPFHQEKTPSCKVDDGKGFFYCFGCGASGDAIEFVRKIKNVSFQEAVKELASMAGMDAGDCSYKPSHKELAGRNRQREAFLRECEADQPKSWEEAAVEALQRWTDGIPIFGCAHPYLEDRGVEAFGLKLTRDYVKIGAQNVPAGSLLIPLYDAEGKLWSWQFYPQEKRAGESKWPRFFMSGGRIKGCFYLIGDETERILLCEGYTTAASVHMATDEQTVACFSARNIPVVAFSLRKKYPKKEIIICADSDEVGLTHAKEAGVMSSSYVVFPLFTACSSKDGSSNPTDFNDLQKLEGIEKVREQISGAFKRGCHVR